MLDQGRGRQLRPPALDIGVERLADQGAENAVKVETGKIGRPGQLLETEVPADVEVDIIDDPVDAGSIFGPEGLGSIEANQAGLLSLPIRRSGEPFRRDGIFSSGTRGFNRMIE